MGVIIGATYSVQPLDIDVRRSFKKFFGDDEDLANAARAIVLYCNEQEEWVAFAFKEFKTFCERHNLFSVSAEVGFDQLLEEGIIVVGKDYEHYVTEEFVKRCPGIQIPKPKKR